MATTSTRRVALRAVLVGYALGHIVTATLFVLWPSYFLEGTGARPPWPLSLFQFGSWPPTHAGFMAILGMYDLAVAFALLLAAANPARHTGLIVFAIVLWLLHGGAHAALILWGDSPAQYWGAVAELWLGAALLSLLFPRALPSTAAASARSRDERVRGEQAFA